MKRNLMQAERRRIEYIDVDSDDYIDDVFVTFFSISFASNRHHATFLLTRISLFANRLLHIQMIRANAHCNEITRNLYIYFSFQSKTT